ncbi:MAG: hypothetical protein ACLPWF_26345 [Bryobacteraceae bacterium]
MHQRLIGSLLICAAIALGQSAPPANKPAPRTADGKPDLDGLWGPDRTFIYDISSTLKKGETLPLQPWAEQLAKKRMSKDDPEANCLPAGVPRMAPYPWKIVQQPKLVVFLFEGNIHSYRQIFLDGRGHPDSLDPTWYGHSVGHWDGDTLVVDSIGFNDKFWFDFAGHPHTEKLHITERYRRPNYDTLEFEVVIDDPGAYTKPFTMYGHSPLMEDSEIMEYICNENNQDVSHILGKDTRK